MGISGLIPFLKESSKYTNIKNFKGCTVAIDSYCWLHRGAFACAEKLILGEATDQYVYYCMKYVNTLLSFEIKPIMVFDGCNLPSKKNIEEARKEKRKANRQKAAVFLREGKRNEARQCLQNSIDVTSQMALKLMEACRAKNVDCIVAPYEADAQLAFLANTGVAQIVITEDSDLLLFGCERVMFKMDQAGNGLLIEKCNINKSVGFPPDLYTFYRFRTLCILSGCDYLANLPGIGLKKAKKLLQLTRQTDIDIVLQRLPNTLQMKQLFVPREYIEGFHRAENTFLYQLVFDPISRKIVPLNPYPIDLDPDTLHYAGPPIEKGLAYQIALGNVDTHTMQTIANFSPDEFSLLKMQTKSHQLSIWNKEYQKMPMEEFSKYLEKSSRVPEKNNHVAVNNGMIVPVKRKLPQDSPSRVVYKPRLSCAEKLVESPMDDVIYSSYFPKNNFLGKSDGCSFSSLPDEENIINDYIHNIDEETSVSNVNLQRDVLSDVSSVNEPKNVFSIAKKKEFSEQNSVGCHIGKLNTFSSQKDKTLTRKSFLDTIRKGKLASYEYKPSGDTMNGAVPSCVENTEDPELECPESQQKHPSKPEEGLLRLPQPCFNLKRNLQDHNQRQRSTALPYSKQQQKLGFPVVDKFSALMAKDEVMVIQEKTSLPPLPDLPDSHLESDVLSSSSKSSKIRCRSLGLSRNKKVQQMSNQSKLTGFLHQFRYTENQEKIAPVKYNMDLPADHRISM